MRKTALLVPEDSPPSGNKTVAVSRSLLSAAIGGLLCIGTAACNAGPATPRAASGDAGPMITSSKVDPNMTLDEFTKECGARNGTVEISAHCGGTNSCKGMSYDTTTHVLTEHTCKGMNACAGYSCVIPS